MDIWESYERLPPLARIIITFSVTSILVFIIYLIDKKFKHPRNIGPDMVGRAGNVERTPDGTLLAYIAFWRYLIFGALFAPACYACIHGFVILYQDLPSGFYKHWNEDATITFFILILAVAMFLWGYFLLKSVYKKVQFKLNNHNVCYLRNGIRGGIVFSESTVSVPLRDILDVELSKNLFGGGVITARTPTQTYKIILLLSAEEQQICFQALQNAIHSIKLNQIA
jgi:hypothetical protein